MVIRLAGKIDDHVLTKEAFLKIYTERVPVGGRGGRGGRSGPNQSTIDVAAKAAWDQLEKNQDEVDINKPGNTYMKRRLESINGYKLPENGKLTKEEFLKAYAQVVQQRAQDVGEVNSTRTVATGTSYYFKRPVP